MFTFDAPGGRSSLSIRPSNPDPNRRYSVTISDGFCIGADGLRDLAKKLKSFADQVDPKSSPKKAPAPKAAEGGDE